MKEVILALTVPTTAKQWICAICFWFIIYLINRFCIAPYRNLKRLGLKFPTPTPLLGNLFDYGATNQHIAQLEWHKKYGRVYASLFFQIPTIWISKPNML